MQRKLRADAMGDRHKNDRTLFIYPHAGLGNRLNCLYSGLYWQKRLGMKMKILWEIETCCSINFESLFLPLPDVRIKTVYNLSLRGKKRFRSMLGKCMIGCLKRRSTYLSSEATRDLFYDGGEAAVEQMLLDPQEHCIKAFSAFAGWDHISEVVDYLKPAEKIKARVDTIMNPCKGRRLIGVHIRRTDNVWAIENSPLSVFTEQMRKLLRENPDTWFYLATDDEGVERQLSREFPLIRHINFSNEKTRGTEAGMMDAYVDMLCLSRCDRVYGSFGSTFSWMAAVIGKKECVILKK